MNRNIEINELSNGFTVRSYYPSQSFIAKDIDELLVHVKTILTTPIPAPNSGSLSALGQVMGGATLQNSATAQN